MTKMVRAVAVLAALGVLLAVMANLAGLFERKIAIEPVRSASEPTPSGVIVVAARDEPVIERAVGTVRPKDETVVSSRLTAGIASVNVRAGDAVEKGEVLVLLDDRELRARLEQAREAVRAASAQLDEAMANYRRVKSLFDRGTASSADLDRAEVAQRAYRAQLAGAEQAEEEARTTLSYSVLRAPLSGRVIERYADPGDTATTGSPLVRLYDPARLRLESNVRESLAVGLSRGDALTATIDALGRRFDVTVDEVVPSGDPGSRTFVVKLRLPAESGLYPGMFGRVEIETGRIQRVYLPADTVSRVGQLEFVSVLTARGVERRFVRTGHRSPDGRVEILSGLTAGERVVGRSL